MKNSSTETGLFSFYLYLIRAQKTSILFHFFLLIISIGILIPIPFLVGNVIDGLSQQIAFIKLAPYIASIVGIMMFGVLLTVLIQKNTASINKKFLVNTQLTIFSSFQTAPLMFVNDFNVSDVFSRLSRDIATLNYLSPAGIAGTIRDICFIFVFGGILIFMNLTIVLFIVGLLPLAIIFFIIASRRLSALSSYAHKSHASANAKLLESLTGIRNFRSTGTLSFNQLRLALSLEKSGESFFQVNRYKASMFGVLATIPVIVSALIWIVGGLSVETGDMSVGQLVAFLFVLSMLYGPINSLFGALSGYVYEQAAIKRIANIVYKQSGVVASGNASLVFQVKDILPDEGTTTPIAVELKNASFFYKDKAVLTDFSAVFPEGLCTAVVGINGAGKSTLLSIILGLIPPAAGGVFINNKAFSELERDYIVKNSGYLPQDILILGDSLRLNITLGRDINDEQIYAVLNDLGLSDFLLDWQDGLDTVVLEGGRNISGGRKQKIGLLRAVVNKPALLVLDEPENNLDKIALIGLYNYLQVIKGFCTIVLVTHGATFDSLIDITMNLQSNNLSADE